MRRLILEEPIAPAAIWSRRCAVLALFIAGFGVIFARFGLAGLPNAVAVVIFALFLAVIALVLAGFAYAAIWTHGHRGINRATLSIILALALLAWPTFQALRSFDLPRMTDISTDISDPPAYFSSARVAALRGFTPQNLPRQAREPQMVAYPDIQPLVLDLSAEDAMTIVEAAIHNLGWKRLDAQAAVQGIQDGRIEVLARSLLMHVPYAIIIRIRTGDQGARIDIRSTSNLGAHDFGGNASHIRRLIGAIQAESDQH